MQGTIEAWKESNEWKAKTMKTAKEQDRCNILCQQVKTKENNKVDLAVIYQCKKDSELKTILATDANIPIRFDDEFQNIEF